MPQYEMVTGERLEKEGVKVKDLWDLVQRFISGKIELPPHQRKAKWSEKRMSSYIDRIRSETHPPGGFETYQIPGRNRKIYLNDGHNRLHTLKEYLADPILFGDSASEAETVLRCCEIAVRHTHYQNHEMALVDFILVNLGAVATPYEQCKGLLLYMSDDNNPQLIIEYGQAFDLLHTEIEIQAGRVAGRKTSDPNAVQKYKRFNYSLLYRLLIKDKAKTNYKVSKGKLEYTDITSKSVIEWKLRSILSKCTIKEIKEKIALLMRHVKKETATIKTVWNDTKDSDLDIRYSCYLWLLDMSIWKHNNKILAEDWVSFLRVFFKNNRGNNRVVDQDDDRRYCVLTLSNLGRLGSILKMLKFKFPDRKARRTQSGFLQEGMDASHIEPYDGNGGGETIPEPASINRARGKQSMKEYDPLGLLEKTQ